MPRIKSVNPSVDKHIHLPTDLCARVELELYSDLEGRVPFGAWQTFVTKLIKEHFELIERRRCLAQELERIQAEHKDDPCTASMQVESRVSAELRALGYGRAADVFDQYAGAWK